MSDPFTTITNLAGLVVFQGRNGPGLIPAPTLQFGMQLACVVALSGSLPGATAAAPATTVAPGTNYAASFSVEVVEGPNLVQIDESNLSGVTYIGLVTG